MSQTIKTPLSFLIVDDDRELRALMRALLERDGHQVQSCNSGLRALEIIRKQKFDCIILDLMIPGIDGLELCKRIRNELQFHDIKIIFVSSKAFEFDRMRALSMGGDGFISKPLNASTFIKKLFRYIESNILLRYWGVRGTMPVCGHDSLKYGGNTSCVTLEFPKGEFFIFDAGSGIKSLSKHLLSEKRTRISAQIFISHPHWDHINALPFFDHLYMQGNEFEILGAAHSDITMRELISAQMDGVYFPIRIKEFAARVYFRDLMEETLGFGAITVRTMLLNHPGNCLGYRIEYAGKVVCYVTDNELPLADSPYFSNHYVRKLTEFVSGADILITDTTYSDDEYKTKELWGHSSVSQVTYLANAAGVKNLHLFHHDPDQTDIDIEKKLSNSRTLLAKLSSDTQCIAPREGQKFFM
ncbi:MAG: response regulator [Mariprofundales bacterium]